MVDVKITETYDMRTTVGKLGIIGIHTPDLSLVRRLYPGLIKNHRYIRFKSCTVVGACASVLPADPLQIGVEEGTIAPEDMFNPILMRAVTNESFDSVLSRIYANPDASYQNRSYNKNELDNNAMDSNNNFAVYYALLGSRGWRKAMPQSGFSLTKLVPLAHTIVSNFGNVQRITGVSYGQGASNVLLPNISNPATWYGSGYGIQVPETTYRGYIFRGKAVRMPRFALHITPESYTDTPAAGQLQTIPTTFVGCIVVPPAKLNQFYFRMRITWTISFEELIPTTEYADGSSLLVNGAALYANEYAQSEQSKELPDESDSIRSDGVEINKIMEV